MPLIRSSKSKPGHYVLNGTYSERELLQAAEHILAGRIYQKDKRVLVDNTAVLRPWLRTRFAKHEREVFTVIYLDNQHHMIGAEDLFHGTIDATNVYPREIIKNALACNASVLIIAHNHISGVCKPSQADRRLTEKIQAALGIVDMRLLDHYVVTDGDIYSFAQNGLI